MNPTYSDLHPLRPLHHHKRSCSPSDSRSCSGLHCSPKYFFFSQVTIFGLFFLQLQKLLYNKKAGIVESIYRNRISAQPEECCSSCHRHFWLKNLFLIQASKHFITIVSFCTILSRVAWQCTTFKNCLCFTNKIEHRE